MFLLPGVSGLSEEDRPAIQRHLPGQIRVLRRTTTDFRFLDALVMSVRESMESKFFVNYPAGVQSF